VAKVGLVGEPLAPVYADRMHDNLQAAQPTLSDIPGYQLPRPL
jgi:hypothetical protein